MKRQVVGAIALFSFSVVISYADGAVNLEWRPPSQNAAVNDIAEIGLYAVSDSGSDQSIAAIEVIVSWDPAKLELLGFVNNGPYSWLASYFPNDAPQDGLNAPYSGVPANDGNAWYNSLSRFPPNPTAMATPGGLLVTTFRFRVLSTDPTQVTMAQHVGSGTYSQVWSGDIPGLTITGLLSHPSAINGPAVPALGTLGMMATGVLMVGAAYSVVRKRSGTLSAISTTTQAD